MSVFPYSFRRVFVGSGAVRTTGHTEDLVAGELSLVDAESYAALALGATYSTNRTVLFAQGSYHDKDVLNLGHGGYKESIKSRPIEGHSVTDWRVVTPKKPKNHVVKISGVGGEADKTYTLRLFLRGEPVLKFANRYLYKDFIVQTTCGDPCADSCNPTSVDCNFIADNLVKQINDDIYFSKFVKATKKVNCDTPASVTKVNQEIYTLTVCDTGDAAALAAVQLQYPTQTITRVSREGVLSTYAFCQVATASAPADFSLVHRAVPNCDACANGYTMVDAAVEYIVRLEDDGVDKTATVQALPGAVANSAFLLRRELGQGTYIVYTDDALTSGEIATFVGANPSAVFINMGLKGGICVSAAETVAWVLDDAVVYKTKRDLTLTLQKTCGGDNRLADLQAFYASVAGIVSGSLAVQTAGTCEDTYVISQYNNACLEDGCEAPAVPEFNPLPSFEGMAWTPVEASAGTGCTCDIILEGAYVETKFGNCSFLPTDGYELDHVIIDVHQLQDEFDRCGSGWKAETIQLPQYASGTGEWLVRELITFMNYRQEPWFDSARMREAQDIDWILSAVDRKKYYKLYYFTYNVPYKNNSTNLYNNEQYELIFAFPEEVDTTTFENIVNSYVGSVGIQLKAV